MKKNPSEDTSKIENTGEIILNKKVVILIIVIALALLGVFLYFLIQFNAPSRLLAAQKTDQKKESESILEKIGVFYELPKEETPTIATVSDKTKLQKQAFFAKAENGDKVIIYEKDKKALLYRPAINKLIEVAPLSIGSTPTPLASTSAIVPIIAEKIIKISIYNGTKIAGLAATTEKKILAQFNNIKVIEKGNAGKDYTGTIVIDAAGNNTNVAKSLADMLGGLVSTLPVGEKSPQGEILVIMGK